MARSIWSGAISFGLVNVPIKLYSAVNRKTVRFHQLHDDTGVRIQQRRVDPSTGEEVPYDNIVKGYEIGPDKYVVVSPDELEALDPKKTRSIDINEFVDLEQIDPIFFDHPYYLAPGQGGAKAYKLLLDAMGEQGKVAIGRVVIRSKENLVAIRPMGDVLGMTTMLFADEVVDPESIDELDFEEVEVGDRELKMAQQLIDSLSGDFEPEKYRDEYREAVLDLIERKAEGQEIAVQPEVEEPGPVPDLMAALEASIQAAQTEGDGKASARKTKSKAKANGSGGGKKKAGPGGKGGSGSGGRKRAAAKK